MLPVNEENAIEVAQRVKAGELPGAAKSLAEAMHRVMEQVGYVQKKGTIAVGKGYKFAGEAQFIEALRPELVAQQIVVCPVGMEPLVTEVFAGSSGPQNRVVIRVTWRFTHAPTGQTLDVVTCGEGIDNGDKATNKAQTGALKYALRQAFLIETGNDPDATPSNEQERKPAVQAAAKPAPAQPTEYARKMVARLDAVKSRNEGVVVWNEYDADFKAGKIRAQDKAEIDAAFALLKQRFPAPAKV